MQGDLRIVTRLPLDELWDQHGGFGERLKPLTSDDVQAMLRIGPHRFVVADVGLKLRWIAQGECFDFWSEVRSNIANSFEFRLERFPREFAFVASEWLGRDGEHLLVLEKHH